MTLKLSVDTLNNDGTMGKTSNPLMMIKNSQLAKNLIKKDSKQNDMFFSAGRFIVSTLIINDTTQKDTGHAVMLFTDFKKNRQAAIDASHLYKQAGDDKLFLYLFELNLINYDKNYNEVELVLDESFNPSFLSDN